MLHVELTVGNTDSIARNAVVLTLVYPAGLNSILPGNFGASCPPSFCDPGETVTWNLGTVAAGRSVTVDMPPFVSAATADGTIVQFNAAVTDSTLEVANASVSTQVKVGTLYDIALRDNADPVRPGDLLTYKIIFGYREEALALATNTLQFPLPAGTSFVSATGGGSLQGSTVEWNLGTMAPGEGGVREVTTLVTAADDDNIEATARIFNAATPDAQATASALTVVDSSPLLSLHIDADADPARPGEQLNVQLVVTNHDAITRTGLSLRLRYPDGISSVATSNINGATCPPSFCDPGERVVWTIASLAPGQAITLEIAPFVAAATPDGTLVNFFAMLNDAAGGNATAIDSVRVRTLPAYDLAIRDSADPVEPGAMLSYKISFGYREEALAPSDSTLSFSLPAGTAFVSASHGGTAAGNVVSWNLGTLAPGDGGNREVVALVNAVDASVLRASAQIFDTDHPVQQAAAEGLTVVDANPVITVQIDANADPARPGELLNVQAVVTNADAIARTLTLRMRYPDNLNSVFTTNVHGSSCPPSFCDPGEIVTWALGSIAPGGSTTVEIAPFVQAAAQDGLLINFLAIANDTIGGNASAIDTVRVQASPDYDLAVRDSVDPVQPGATLVYKLSFGYREEALANAPSTLRMRLAPGTSFVAATGGGALAGTDVLWNLGTLRPGDGGFREVTVQVNGADSDVLQVSAEIFSDNNQSQAAAAEALTTVQTAPALEVQVDANADPVRAEMLNVQYVVTNHDVVARTVTLRGRYPFNTNAVAVSNLSWSTPGTCPPSFCDPGELVTWSMGSIAAGQSVTVEIMPTVAAAAADGLLLNFSAIATDTAGGVASSSDHVNVHMASRYDLMIQDSADAVAPGDLLTYKMTFGYRADAPAIADSRMRFRLPANTSFVSASSGGSHSGDFVQWNLGAMSPGDGGLRTVTVLVNAPDSAILQAQAEIFDIAAPARHSAAEALTAVDSNPPLLLEVRANTNPSQPNQVLNVELVVTNRDTIDRTVSLRLRYPDGLFSLGAAQMVPVGSCPPSFCDPTEMITWNLGLLGAGQSTTVMLLPTVINTAVNGQLINFFAIATDTAGGIATGIDTVRIGVCLNTDADCDGIEDSMDNCLYVDNANQRDTDGDGIGNACDADIAVPNNCQVNFLDLGVMKAAFFSSPSSSNWNPHADLDGSNQVNFQDLGIMKGQFFMAPGPSGVPNLCGSQARVLQ